MAASQQSAVCHNSSRERGIPTTRDDEAALTTNIIALARQHGRYSYRRITALLREAGWVVNKKRVGRNTLSLFRQFQFWTDAIR
jgi:hypothetical protein